MKYLLNLSVLLFIPVMLKAQPGGKVMDDLSMKSAILNMDRKYAIYLPPDYETSQRSYPVLYLLHGSGDDQTGWVQFGEVKHITDQAIASGRATPMIIVMPDANTGQRGYFNSISGDWRYEDFFFQEFMPYIEKTYRIKGDKRYRAVAGLSMGGGGTFMYALHHPELFSSACPMSASCGPLSFDDASERYKRNNPDLTDDQIRSYYEQHSVLALLDKMPDDQKTAVRWYITIGDDDYHLYEGNSRVHISMRQKEIPHEYRVGDGTHSWVYWRSELPNALEFVSQAFHQN